MAMRVAGQTSSVARRFLSSRYMLFSALESYALGPEVIDLIGMVTVIYLVLALVATPVAAVSFRHHQVA